MCCQSEGSPQTLAEARNYQIIDTFAPAAGEQVIELLNSSIARGLLIAVFILSVNIAFSAPGPGAAEATAVIAAQGFSSARPLYLGYAVVGDRHRSSRDWRCWRLRYLFSQGTLFPA